MTLIKPLKKEANNKVNRKKKNHYVQESPSDTQLQYSSQDEQGY